MTIYLDRWNPDATPSPAWEAVDIDANAISDFVLTVSYEPAILKFKAALPQQTTTVGGLVNGDFIRVRHSTYDGGGGAGVDPVFEGRLTIEPSEQSIGVTLTAIDPTGYSNYPLMTYGWELDGSDVVPVTGGRPRVLWNCKQDTDDDYPYARDYAATVAEIIETILTDQKEALKAEFAGPADGSDAWTSTDITTLTASPQDKFVAEAMNTRPALAALLQENYPTWRIVWEPGTRLWRFVDLKAATEVTLTLNSSTATDVVLAFEPHISVEDRYTAVEIFGPPAVYQWDEFHAHPFVYSQLNGAVSAGATTIAVDDGSVFPATPPDFTVIIEDEIVTVTGISGNVLTVLPLADNHADDTRVSKTAEITLLNGGLTNLSGTDYDLESWGAGVHVYGIYKLQITDTDKRHVFRRLAWAYNAPSPGMTSGNPEDGFTVISTHYETALSPVMLAKFAANNMGDGKWQAFDGWEYDASNGIIYFGSDTQPTFLYRYNPVPPLVSGVTGPHCENPTDIQFVFCSPADPLKVRYPEEGFEGTAYDLYGVEKVYRLSDEMLALDYERDPLLTSTDRLTHFTALAQQTHAKLCDVVFAGVAKLSGLRWDYLHLSKRIHVAAVDQDGGTLTTGWEDAGAWLTEVTYDFSEQTTTLVLNSNQLELMGLDVEKIKKSLGIRKLTPVYQRVPFTTYTSKPVSNTATYQAGQTDATKAALSSEFRSGIATQLVGYVDEQGRMSNG